MIGFNTIVAKVMFYGTEIKKRRQSGPIGGGIQGNRHFGLDLIQNMILKV